MVRAKPGWRERAPKPRCTCKEVQGRPELRFDRHKATCSIAVDIWNFEARRPGHMGR